MFLRHFKAILDEQIPGDGEGWTIIDTIRSFDGYIDLATLTSWLLFSGQQVGRVYTLPFLFCAPGNDR